MALVDQLLRKIAVPTIVNCLTGEMSDLKRLLLLEKLPHPNPVLRAFLKRLARDMEKGNGLAGLLLHLGKHSNPLAMRKLIENLVINWKVKGAPIRVRLRKEGQWVPFFVVFSPTMRCNLNCTGCYSGLYSKDGELSEQDIDRLLEECKSIGSYFAVLTGGEPYLLKGSLLRLFKKHNDMYFLTYTNGTHFDEDLADELARLGNVAPAFSVEGYEKETDERRRKGVHESVRRAMKMLKERRTPFGISVTYTRDNVNLVTDEAFVEYYLEKGAVFAWYFMFVPVGKDPVLEMVPTPEQRVHCGKRIQSLREKYPLFMADFWNDGPAAGGCLAGGRRYLHILNSGRVEICVFAHFGVDNIRETSILEAANSPFFRAIRNEFPYNETGNLKRPCLLTDNPDVLRRLVDEYMVPEGHAHSEDIIRDSAVRSWIDTYSKQFKDLTEPEWLEIIENPQNRWYKGKEEYKNLFKFGDQPRRRIQEPSFNY
jgi:MoaA/NifB/PqqE/SkfB family radical SAM enzyme